MTDNISNDIVVNDKDSWKPAAGAAARRSMDLQSSGMASTLEFHCTTREQAEWVDEYMRNNWPRSVPYSVTVDANRYEDQ